MPIERFFASLHSAQSGRQEQLVIEIGSFDMKTSEFGFAPATPALGMRKGGLEIPLPFMSNAQNYCSVRGVTLLGSNQKAPGGNIQMKG